MKQTAVEWLEEQIRKEKYEEDIDWDGLFKQAKAMEKEQIMEFTNNYVLTQCNADFNGNVTVELSTEEYYKLTFKTK